MKYIKNKRLVVMLLSITAIVIIASFFGGAADQPTNDGKISLAPPPFLISAQAAANNEIADRLDEEAGISAYFETTGPINLNNAANAYRVIEAQTADYIIGSVPVTGYEEHFDVHVYIHKDGWFLAYYIKQDPIAKIVDIENHTISTTNLHTVLTNVAIAAGVTPPSSVYYYDFRYPNATHILMVGENITDGADFTITLPSSYGYYERGFSQDHNYTGLFFLDGNALPLTYHGSTIAHGYGVITATQLLPDIEHTVVIDFQLNYGVLIIIYSEG